MINFKNIASDIFIVIMIAILGLAVHDLLKNPPLPVVVTVPAPCGVLATKTVTYPDYHTKGVEIYCKDGTEYDVMVYRVGPDLCSGIYADVELYNHCEAQPPTEWVK